MDRRTFLGHLAGGAAVSVMAVDPKPSLALSPVSTLPAVYAEYCRYTTEQDLVEARADAIREHLIATWGDHSPAVSAAQRWGHDPLLIELQSANRESDRIGALCGDLEDTLTETPAVTVDDLLAKLRVTISVWERTGSAVEHPDWHERMALAAMRDAERFLSAGGRA